jgi:hypothetical protein
MTKQKLRQQALGILLLGCGPQLIDPGAEKRIGRLGPSDGQVYCRKVAKNFGQCVFLSAREIEHGQFRALFAGTFWPKMQNGRTSPKSKKN